MSVHTFFCPHTIIVQIVSTKFSAKINAKNENSGVLVNSFRMDIQDENKLQEFDSEVDSVVRKSKRKLSEGQLKVLAEGRRKRWEEKRSKTSDVSVLAEETPSDVDSELITKEEKSDNNSSECEASIS